MSHCRPIIDNEEARLNALRDLNLLDTPPSDAFDRITRLASRLIGAPVSTISLTDADRQWFKSRVGVEMQEIPREQAPCAYAIQRDQVFIVPDMLEDPRFESSPLAQAGIRFYAGAPLVTREGYGLGTLAVIDVEPRTLSDEEVGVLRDLAGMVMTQVEVQNMIGRIDASSGYPNQHQFLEDLGDLLLHRPEESRLAMLIEVAAPQHVSHGARVLGSGYAEELIRNAIPPIRRALGEDVRLYQVGAMHLAVILDEAEGRLWSKLAAEVEGLLRQPIRSGGLPVFVDPAIGVHSFRMSDAAPRDVLRCLFTAVHDARSAGHSVGVYSPAQDTAQARSFTILKDVQNALSWPEDFSLIYQPRINLQTGQCAGAEALLRWRHPVLGPVSPGEFVPLVEQTPLARLMTEWVLTTAIAQIARWRSVRDLPRISINASAINLEEPDFAERLAHLLARHEVAAEAIELEFTESMLARDKASAVEQLNALRRHGVTIAIDDFGAGYSSLSQLQRLPASVLKIDQSLVTSLSTSPREQKLVRAMIKLAHDLGYVVVAEGVETQEVFEMLSAWGCDEAQGFHIAHALPASTLPSWLAVARQLARRWEPPKGLFVQRAAG